MRIPFTKMHGAGNDFVVLDETAGPLIPSGLTAAHYRFLADRHFGVGADQILTVRAAPSPEVDFGYLIHNADGSQVDNCGNGARCFVRYVRERGLTDRDSVRVQLASGRRMTLHAQPDGHVTVDMGAPVFELPHIPFDPCGMTPRALAQGQLWPLPLPPKNGLRHEKPEDAAIVLIAVASMGNPHAVLPVDHVNTAPVAEIGPRVQQSPAFGQGVNVGFMQVLSRQHIALRVYERGAGETLACGTGACAAVVSGIRLGWLAEHVQVDTRGGTLSIAWSGQPGDGVHMTGPAQTVFESHIELPTDLSRWGT